MEAIQKVDTRAIESHAAQAARAGDLETVGSIIAEVEAQQRAFLH